MIRVLKAQRLFNWPMSIENNAACARACPRQVFEALWSQERTLLRYVQYLLVARFDLISLRGQVIGAGW